MQTIESRCAAFTDIDDITLLWEQFMTTEGDAVSDADPLSARTSWLERLRRQITRQHLFVALCDQRLVGFVGAIDSEERQWIPGGILYIVDIYVQPAARATMAASRLMHALGKAASAAGYQEIWTNTDQRNHRVQVLLPRNGFHPLQGFTIPGLSNQCYYRKFL